MKITVIDKGVEKEIDTKLLKIGNMTLEELASILERYKRQVDIKQQEIDKMLAQNKELIFKNNKYEAEISKLKEDTYKLKEFFVKMLKAFLFREAKDEWSH